MCKIKDHNLFLDTIKSAANDRIYDILEAMGCVLNSAHTEEFRCSCPIHGGDNETAFSYNTEYKSWRCYTNQCHNKYVSNIFGLVQGYLKNNDKPHSFNDSIKWLSKFLNIDIKSLHKENIIDEELYTIKKLVRQSKTKVLKSNSSSSTFSIRIEDFKKNYKVSKYFLDQGFSENILTKYLITDCFDINKPMYNRACVPIINEQGTHIIGVTGRIMMDKCQYCNHYHEKTMGCYERKIPIPKWKHYGFKSGQVLFNYNFANRYIKNSKTAIIVEGPKDVLAFESNDIHNSICMHGLKISKYHITKLLNLGVMNLILALDNDDAANESKEIALKILNKYFKIYDISNMIDFGTDFADLNTEEFNNHIKPKIKNMEFKINV